MSVHNPQSELPLRDRTEAGRMLADRLRAYAGRSDAIVLALPRGGIPVGAEIAAALELPLFVFVVRKLGVPGHDELAMGAVATGGRTLMNQAIINSLHISQYEIGLVVERELRELERRQRLYCRGRQMPDLRDKIVILTDDGVATGSSMLLAAQAIRAAGAAYLVLAVPVAPVETVSQLHRVANQVVCLATPEPFVAVGACYEDFRQVDDHEVCQILDGLLEHEAA
ncbi:MAG TPA: phosphoribosyltransferase family protein [Candidatus Angelobacter sp.]